MDDCRISIRDVHLYYPSALFNGRTLKQTVFELLRLQKPKPLLMDVHALKGLSLEISSGERVGIIGSNGAGKSTLLKAISGIYPITSGTIEVNGTVRSLFDLSIGFEVDATGRENILYRGLLLGESPESIEARMDDIIEFAELGEFIDYPIKSYSSGMLVRLAFSISTMISGDILLLDEIFGAGDAAFMQKARKRITDLVDSASILVFVSHDLSALSRMCTRVVWIDNGTVRMDGLPYEVINEYYKAHNIPTEAAPPQEEV
ncbi:MAG: ABC transporter ATP-binding protein [Ruminococcaceae bacterium]|nr:ABC transporter ATP-binding protein [Oscillospiraceae bacterium]